MLVDVYLITSFATNFPPKELQKLFPEEIIRVVTNSNR